jgi:AcrR family transcriptional regulator
MIDEFKYEEKLTEKQRNILVAAQKVFYEKGFHAGSTSEIAREANVAEGTIFRHYKNKKELLLSVVFPVLIKMAAPGILKDARKLLSNQEEPLEGILEKLIKNRLQVVKENWPRLKIAFIESQYHPEIKEAMEKYLANEGRMFLEAFLSARVESGEIKNKNVQIMTRTVFSTLAGYIISRHFFEDEGNEEEEIAVIVDILLHGLKITSSKL